MRTLLTFLLITVLLNSARSQAINYSEVFGDDWKKAETFEKENRSWMEPLLTNNHISYPLAVAVIFPELVRYSALLDKMEITLLKTLYINLGDDYANFSIGQFQMKPSFAEIIRVQAPAVMGRKSEITFKNRSEFDKIYDFRRSIVTDLEDPKIQLNYLVVFIKVCEKKYKISRKDEVQRLKFLATAYNYGIDKSADQIETMLEKKFFNTKLFKTENYSYADVSLFWYKQYIAMKDGIGSRKLDLKLTDGTINTFGLESDPKIAETIAALTGLVSKTATAITDLSTLKGFPPTAASVTITELYDIIMTNGLTSVKRIEIK